MMMVASIRIGLELVLLIDGICEKKVQRFTSAELLLGVASIGFLLLQELDGCSMLDRSIDLRWHFALACACATHGGARRLASSFFRRRAALMA